MTQRTYSGTFGRPQLLLVDDEAAILRAAARMLRATAREWQVHCAAGGHEALDVLSKRAIDVLITDLDMPTMRGEELLVAVSAQFPHVVRIAHSADRTALGSELVRTHTSFALAKPVSAELFASTLEAALALRQAAASPATCRR